MAKPRKKIIKRALISLLVVLLTFLFGLGGLGGWLVYLYHHPERLKPRLEKYISRLAGVTCHIQDLNYSLDPISIQVKGLNIVKAKELDLEIGNLNIKMIRVSEERKKLIIQEVDLKNFSANINKIPTLPKISSAPKRSSSLFFRLINKIKEAYLFQDLEFGILNAENGTIDFQSQKGKLSINRIMARVDVNQSSEINFGLRAEYGKDRILIVPETRISTDVSPITQAARIPIQLAMNNLSYHDQYASADNISLRAVLEYNPKQKSITLASSHLLSPKILINPGNREATLTPPLEIKASGDVNLPHKSFKNTHVDLNLGSLVRLEANLNGHFRENPDLTMDIMQCTISPEKLRPFIPLAHKEKLDPFYLDGKLSVTGQLHAFNEQPAPALEFFLKTYLEQNRLAYKHKDTNAEGTVTGEIILNGKWPDWEIKADIKTKEAGVRNPLLKIDSEKMDIELKGKYPLFQIKSLSGQIPSVRVQANKKEYLLQGIRVESQDAEIDLSENHFRVPSLEFSAPFLKNIALDLTLARDKENTAKLQDLGSWSIDLKAAFSDFDLGHKNDSTQTTGFLSGDIHCQGQWPEYQVSAWLKTPDARILSPWGSIDPRDLKLTLEIKHPQYYIHDLTGAIVQVVVRLGKKEFPVNDISINLPYGDIDLGKKALDIPRLIMTGQPLGKALLSFKGKQNDLKLKLKCDDSQLIKSASSWNLLPKDWQLDASETIEIEANLKEDLHGFFASRFTLDNLTLSNSDATVMGENISLKSTLAGDLDTKNRQVKFDLDLRGQKGELLLNNFYFNLSPNPLSLRALFKTDFLNEQLDISRLNSTLKDIISIDLEGQVRNISRDPSFKCSLLIPKSPVKPIFRHFIQEPFQSKRTILKELNIDGHISANLKIEGNKNINGLKGQFTLDDIAFDLSQHDIRIDGVNLELPLWYEKQAVNKPQPAMQGRLAIESISTPWIPEQSLSLHLDVNPNQISVRDPTEIIIPGGIALIGPIQGHNIFSNPVVETNLSLDNIELKPWTDKIQNINIQGKLNGYLSPLIFTDNQLKSKGKLTANIADGQIILSNLHLSGLNTPTPVIGLDGSFHHLDLFEITTNTTFGRIKGRLDGYINNLEIAYGQPQSFDLFLETVKEKGIPQRISVEAVDNIAKLGGGQSPFMGLAGAYITFLKDFPYQKIGLRSSLKNDVFRINGTIKEGGQEFIVKRGFYGVNIINKDPDNNIRFKEMVKRIKNLDLSKTKPVIK